MPGTGIWLDPETYLQSAGQLWMQDQQQRIQAGYDWVQQQLQATHQQLQGMVPAVQPPPPPAPLTAPTPVPPAVPPPIAAAVAPPPPQSISPAPAPPPPAPSQAPPIQPTQPSGPDLARAGLDWTGQQVQNLLDSASTSLQNAVLPPTAAQPVAGMQVPGGPVSGLPGATTPGAVPSSPGEALLRQQLNTLLSPQPTPPPTSLAPPAGPAPATLAPTTLSSAGASGSIPASINIPINQGPSITRDQAEAALQGTPLQGLGGTLYDLGVKYNVDPAFALSVAKNESNYGSSAMQAQNNNVFDISNAAYGGTPVAGSRWGQYPDKATAIEAFYKLITQEYYPNGQNTVGSVMWGPGGNQQHAYAPTSENASDYPQRLINTMQSYGAASGPASARATTQPASGQPSATTSGMVFPVVGYQGQINDHWGSVKGGSDIMADRGTPVVAMEGGKVTEAGYNQVGGNSVLIQGNDGNQYYYAHFDQAPSVKVGDVIKPGTFLGPVGNTGDASGGPTHLHIGIGPSILLGADKYGGTGGDYDAVGLLRNVLSGSQGSGQSTGPAGGPQAIVTPSSPVTAPLMYGGNQPAASTTQPALGTPDLRAGLGALGGLLPDITPFLKPPSPTSALSRVVGGEPIGSMSPTDQAQALLDWTRGYEAARTQAMQNVNPLGNVPLLGGLTTQLTDPLQLALFGAAAPAGGAAGEFVGGGALGGVADVATQGALGNALTASVQPGATPSSIAQAAAEGALLGGGIGAVPAIAGPLASRALGALDVLSPPELAYASSLGGPLGDFLRSESGELNLGGGRPGIPEESLGPIAEQLTGGAPEPPVVQPEQAVNITLSKYPQDVQNVVSSFAQALPEDLSAATRGVLGDQAVRDLSQQTGIDVPQILANWNPGQAYNAETLLALRDALAGQGQRVLDAVTSLGDDPASQEARTTLMQELAQHASIQQVLTGGTAEAGRALRQFTQPVSGSQAALENLQRMATEQGLSPDELVQRVMNVNWADPRAVSQLAQVATNLGPVTWADRLRLFHTGGVISDLATLSKVAMNSVLNPIWSFGTRSLADLAGVTGLAPGLSSGEALGRFQGGILGAQSGLAGIGDALAQGLTDVYRNPSSVAMRADNPLDAIFGRVFQTPAALHSALQQAGQRVLEQMELGRLAGQQAASEGLTGQAFSDRFGELMRNPLPGWQDSVTGLAQRAVLRGDLGTLGSMLGNLAGQGAGGAGTARSMIGNILFPVFRVGMNALTQGVEKSPLGLGGTLFDVARGALGAGPYAGGAFEQPLSKAVSPLSERLTNNLIGTALTAWLAQKATDGLITGNGPSDPDQRRELESSGWRANSIMTPWGYASYMGTPLEIPAGLAGALGDALHNPVQPLERQQPVSEMLAGRLLANTVDMLGSRTGLETIGQFVDMMHGFRANPVQAMRQYGTGAIAGTLGSYVPMSGLLRGVARATDPLLRQPAPGDVGAAIAQNIPGLRQQVQPELSSVSGQPIPNPQQGLSAFLPTRLGAGTPGPVETAMSAVGVAPSAVPQTINYGPYYQIRLSADERQQWQAYRGALITRMAGNLVQSPGFQQMSRKARQVDLQNISQQADRFAGELLLRDIGASARAAGRLEPTGMLAPVQGYGPIDLGSQQALARLQLEHQALMNALGSGQTAQQYVQDYNTALATGLI